MGKDINGPVILRSITRAQAAREDTTALLLAKMVQIAEQKDRPYYMQMEELISTSQRAENVIHSLVGLVVQYAEGAGGYLALCMHLVKQLEERNLSNLPLETKWR